MDRIEAIDILRVIAPPRTSKKAFYDFMEARDMAIAALEGKDTNVGDMISRQAAIDIVEFECGEWSGLARTIVKAIKQFPSAQAEIIRCKDCKWYGRADKRRFYRGMDCLQKRIDTIVPDKDFCSRAERRTDE